MLEERSNYPENGDLPILPVELGATCLRSSSLWPHCGAPGKRHGLETSPTTAKGKTPLTPQGLGSSGTYTLTALPGTGLSPLSTARVEESSSPTMMEEVKVWALRSSEGWDIPKLTHAEGGSGEGIFICFKSSPETGSTAWLCWPAGYQFTSSLHGDNRCCSPKAVPVGWKMPSLSLQLKHLFRKCSLRHMCIGQLLEIKQMGMKTCMETHAPTVIHIPPCTQAAACWA